MTARQWKEETARVGGADFVCIEGGSGKPLLVLHDEIGHPGWLKWHAALAANRTLSIPLHPGFGRSARIDWIRSVRDLACFYARFLREQKMAPVDVIGFSFGGWVAAEMAVNDAKQFRRMVLVAPAGIRPPEGEILDQFPITGREYFEKTVLDPKRTPEFETLYGGAHTPEQYEAFEDARAESARLAWQPYFHNPSLVPLLEGIEPPPTLIVWGKEDRVIPPSAAKAYQQAIRGSEVCLLERCGHRPEIEQSAAFIERVTRFLG
ncbi:MAG: alpha/beta fold hydrolase [Candidatus Binatia bacterium]